MKPQTLPVKRRPVPQGIFKRLSAVTGSRKQRVAATASSAAEVDADDGSSRISRALTIIFLIHIVAIGLIFIHKEFLDGRSTAVPEKVAKVEPVAPRPDLPRLATGEKPYIVRQGDNYARIAAAVGVDEGDLRLINKHADIESGLLLKIPPKRIVAVEPPEVIAIREQSAPDQSGGLVEAIDVSDAPKARLIRPNLSRDKTVAAVSGKTYTVQNGDSVWRIANRFKVNQDALMKANGISDPRRIKAGMSLAIPQ